ncbi:MAG: hypothetical protein Q8R02_08495 [Hyphomonadaceae bacterium]|nr:hypothetical protein [Hyphomonadaceae bacterium]
MKRLAVLVGFAAAFSFIAEAQEPRVNISPKATYGDAVVCYQYYTIATELARKLERAQNTSADQAAGFELQAILAKRVLVGWSKRLGTAAGKRTKAQVDADIKKMGAPVLADANAALNGDKAAAKRGVAIGKRCSAHEVVEKS